MPIYEEKLVSPFAIRFTQEHIRTTFRDGRLVETAIEEIVPGSGVGGYDIVLRAPFPPIEILRWCMPRQDADLAAETNCPVGVRPREHWFTLDNRRLFCLQRAAVMLWPARCAAVVMILYADPGTVRKKYDSSSAGFAVSVGHSYDDIPIMRWDWRERILPLELGAVTESHGTLASVIADDRKRAVDALLDASRTAEDAGDSAELADDAAAGMPVSRVLVGGSASSTASPKADAMQRGARSSSSGSEAGSDGGRRRARASSVVTAEAEAPRQQLEPDMYDPVVANAIREIKEQINARGANGAVDLPHWGHRYGPILGPLRAFIESRPDKFHVVLGEGDEFTVVKSRKKAVLERRSDRGGSLAEAALTEIEDQLDRPGNDGRLSLQNWREKYEADLGSLKSFLKLWPDKFAIISGEGRHFRVVKVSDGAVVMAIREIEELLKNPDNDGFIDVPRWRERFEEELGSFLDFLKQHSDRFVVLPSQGGKPRVMRTTAHLGGEVVEELKRQLGDGSGDGYVDIPDWEDRYADALGSLRGFVESRPDHFSVLSDDEHDECGTLRIKSSSGDLTARALQEIEHQIADPKHEGKLRVAKWNQRYRDSLGSLRTFLEKMPDKFVVRSDEGTKFNVTRRSDSLAIKALREIEAIIDRPGFRGLLEVPDWASRYGETLGSLQTLVEAHSYLFQAQCENDKILVDWAVETIEAQAIEKTERELASVDSTGGHVRVPNWSEVYGTELGSFRRFVESHPGRFTVIPEPGNKFSVARVADHVVRDACAEITQQMAEEEYDGLLQLPSWNERFLPFLGTIRQFVTDRPNKFKVYHFGNVMYTFEAEGVLPKMPRGFVRVQQPVEGTAPTASAASTAWAPSGTRDRQGTAPTASAAYTVWAPSATRDRQGAAPTASAVSTAWAPSINRDRQGGGAAIRGTFGGHGYGAASARGPPGDLGVAAATAATASAAAAASTASGASVGARQHATRGGHQQQPQRQPVVAPLLPGLVMPGAVASGTGVTSTLAAQKSGIANAAGARMFANATSRATATSSSAGAPNNAAPANFTTEWYSGGDGESVGWSGCMGGKNKHTGKWSSGGKAASWQEASAAKGNEHRSARGSTKWVPTKGPIGDYPRDNRTDGDTRHSM